MKLCLFVVLCSLDGKHVVFGKVAEECDDVIKEMESCGSDRVRSTIKKCGRNFV